MTDRGGQSPTVGIIESSSTLCLGIVGSWACSRRVKSELRRISDLDIYRAANPLIDQRGEDASIRATELADDSFEAGDTEGAGISRGTDLP